MNHQSHLHFELCFSVTIDLARLRLLIPVLAKFGFFGASALVGDVLFAFGFAGTAGGGFDTGKGGACLESSFEATGGIDSTKSLMKDIMNQFTNFSV